MRGLLFALLLFLLWPTALAARETVTIGVVDYPPFFDVNGEGLLCDIYRAAFAAEGITANIVALPIPRARIQLLTLQLDAAAGNLFLTDEDRPQLLSVPVLNVLPSLFFYLPHFDEPDTIVELHDLRGYQVGVIVNSPLLDVYAEQGLNVVQIQTPEQLLMMAKKRRVDFFEAALLSGLHLIQRELPDERSRFDYVRWGVLESSLTFHRDHPRARELKQRFERGLARLRERGELLKILESYWGAGNVPQAVFIHQYPAQGTEQVRMDQYWRFPRERSGRIRTAD